ncbi:formate--tetrahydrofolate ligase [Bullifex porci]|uniref:formate--tetrahydrofolate ligase n=1 Tax=Bullifex porci TaxID=2606638 RepID=UPI0023F0E028|nr:formate--tetrahydrofolate ligase [Bullifex porci]MDD7587927.1 formate--tetrahydrofolate ligase [Bullifex porci]
MTDIEIANSVKMEEIGKIAKKLDIDELDLELYGRYKAKVNLDSNSLKKKGKLVLVTAINPTPAGEGKTTISIGLADALSRRGVKTALALREPSLGPVFGVKGGAAGGGWAQVVPMEDINLHFTGDLHAITAANNLIAALLDNSIMQGNPLNIDPRTITWKRCMDMNDRQLRAIISGLGGKSNGTPREDGFQITAASEIMATCCLASSMADLKERLARLILARTYDGKLVKLSDIKGVGAVAILLKDAIKPNLVQTLEKTPAFVHLGPFANIAHGCNSVIATKTALSLADVVVTEAGFGADLGAEKFIDIKCRLSGLSPDAIVLVASVRALKYHGGVKKDELGEENVEALIKGLRNLEKHIENIQSVWKRPVTVAINHFTLDTQAETVAIKDFCNSKGINVSFADVWAKGGEGGLELADSVISLLKNDVEPVSFTYSDDITLKAKLESVAKKIYGASSVEFAPGVITKLKKAEEEGYGSYPVCIAKTQYSLSDDQKKLGRPEGFTLHIRDVRVSAGAGFLVAYAGDIMTMPGLSKVPAANGMDISDSGTITGLF